MAEVLPWFFCAYMSLHLLHARMVPAGSCADSPGFPFSLLISSTVGLRGGTPHRLAALSGRAERLRSAEGLLSGPTLAGLSLRKLSPGTRERVEPSQEGLGGLLAVLSWHYGTYLAVRGQY